MEKTQAAAFHIPRWEQLPAVDLYMEQVITLINGSLGGFFGSVGIAPVTKNMINNYVKARIVQAPVERRIQDVPHQG